MEEQVLLQEGIAQFGLNKPTKIATFMGGVRSAEQVREKLKQLKRMTTGARKHPPHAANDRDDDGKLEEEQGEDNTNND